jgi:polyisoprenoid-binding protein YceI
MKLLSNKILMIVLILASGYGYISSCTRENDLIVPIQTNKPPVITRGTNVHLPGNMTTGNTNEWKFDKSHSSVLWSTNYVGASGLLTGRFNQFGLHEIIDAKMTNYVTTGQPLSDSSWAFYENEPAKSYFNGYVQINTSNTGEPGRDAGCNISGMGTVAIVAGTQNLTNTNLAKIRTTEIKFDPASNDYIVTLNLTWQGKLATPLTKSIVGKLKYVPKAKVQFGTAAAYEVFGMQLKFQFNCRDFGIVSTSISDKIDVECNINFHNK